MGCNFTVLVAITNARADNTIASNMPIIERRNAHLSSHSPTFHCLAVGPHTSLTSPAENPNGNTAVPTIKRIAVIKIILLIALFFKNIFIKCKSNFKCNIIKLLLNEKKGTKARRVQ